MKVKEIKGKIRQDNHNQERSKKKKSHSKNKEYKQKSMHLSDKKQCSIQKS